VLVVCGPDRAGLVAATADWLAQHNATIQASYASRLEETHGAQYRFLARQGDLDAIARGCRRKVPALLRRKAVASGPPGEPAQRFELKAVAPARPHALADLAQIFADHRLNIVTHASRRFSAPSDQGLPSKSASEKLVAVNMKVDVPRRAAREVLPGVYSRIASLVRRGWEVCFEDRARGTAGYRRSSAHESVN
jgi:glycine cleavage system regulatory protein